MYYFCVLIQILFMRSLFFLSILMTMLQLNLTGQVTSGAIVYKHTSNINIEGMPPHIASSMPKSAENSMQLLFTKTESLYRKNPDFKEVEDPNDNRPRFFKRMRENMVNTYFKDLDQNTLLQQTNFMGKDFLISDELNNLKWKVSAGEQKTILGYTCMKAYYKDSVNNYVVFFTPQIPVGQGPDTFGGLPGLILEVQSEQVHIIATNISTDDKSDKVVVKRPDKGTKIEKVAFEQLKAEKLKEQTEMQSRQGPSRGMFMRN